MIHKYFVRSEACIGCAACASTAPNNIRMKDDVATVFKQPDQPSELEECEAARLGCPASAVYVGD